MKERSTEDNLPFAFTRSLTTESGVRYLAWKLGGARSGVWLRSRCGPEFELRPRAYGNNDAGVAYEIFVHRYLSPPVWIPPERVKLIVDLDANVGLSCLWWLATYWRAEVMAFEPHPGHVAQCRLNLARNGFESRAMLHPVAAGAADGRAWISDAGSASQLSATPANGYEVEVVDIFPLLIGRRIDILKIDIENSEFELLEDPRFGDLDVRVLVMEWHERADRSGGHAACSERLRELGFRLYPIFDNKSYGTMWGYRTSPPLGAEAGRLGQAPDAQWADYRRSSAGGGSPGLIAGDQRARPMDLPSLADPTDLTSAGEP